jgi:hypothetical protein
VRWLRTPADSGRVARVVGLIPTLVADAAEEGKNVITGMLIVGLIFIGVIALGMLTEHYTDRRRRARARRRAY